MAATKNWTVLIYANGNNDLEPETWRAKQALETYCAGDSVNVVLEIGREAKSTVNIFRPGNAFSKANEDWTGVRRFLLAGEQPVFLGDCGKRNMAHPRSLYEFIKYGMARFPAEHFIVILGGHGYQFVGAMPDYSQEVPYIMGFPGMADALDDASQQAGGKIDLLIADICYFNFIEVIYEFAKHKSHSVQNVLTYICDGPIGGIPYTEIIKALCGNQSDDIQSFVTNVIRTIELDLVGISLDYEKCKSVKNGFDDLAKCYIQHGGKYAMKSNQLLSTADKYYPWHSTVKEVLCGLEQLIISYRRVSKNDYGLINVANTPANNAKLNVLYTKLNFTHDNAWTSLLVPPDDILTTEPYDSASPLILAPEEIYAYISIMNPDLCQQQKIDILKRLTAYKSWAWHC